MIKEAGLVFLGILFLWGSAELIIKASQIIAHRLKISDTFIGLTVLSIGTTLPEFGTHIASSLEILRGTDLSNLAISTNIGSNVFQITVILGIVALFMKLRTQKSFLKKDYLVMLGSILILFLFSLNGVISRLEGLILVSLYFVYLRSLGRLEHFVVKLEKNHSKKRLFPYFLALLVGFIFLFFSSQVVVKNGHFLAGFWGISDSLIGILIIGFGTALPELAAAFVAFKRKSAGMSLGVLVGSNITNPLFGVGIGALISRYYPSGRILWFDLPVWFFLSLLPLFFFWKKLELTKKEAILLISFYLIYAFVGFYYIK